MGIPGSVGRAAALLACAGLIATAAPPGRGGTVPKQGLKFSRLMVATAADDDEMIVAEGPTILLDRSRRAGRSGWIEFDTDPCGSLQGIRDNGSLLTRSAQLDDEMGEDEEPDPSEQGRELIGQWLSEHSEIAVVNDAIDKSCDDARFVPEDSFPESDTMASTDDFRGMKSHRISSYLA